MTNCIYATAARVIASNGSDEVLNFHDATAERDLLNPVALPAYPKLAARYTSPRSKGGFRSGIPRPGEADLVLNVRQRGTSYAQAIQRWVAVEALLELEWDYFVELEAEGVTYRWRTEVPEVIPNDLTSDDLGLARHLYQVRFIVQPNPSVTII